MAGAVDAEPPLDLRLAGVKANPDAGLATLDLYGEDVSLFRNEDRVVVVNFERVSYPSTSHSRPIRALNASTRRMAPVLDS